MGKPRERSADDGLRIAFEQLALTWSTETAHLSSPTKLAEHPAYRQIIGLGPAILPLLLHDLAEHQRFWFPALSAITGENPVPETAAGNIRQMIEAWTTWGREHNLI